jgi:hypothetical protein
MTVEEAKARILRQGGVLVRDAQHAPLAEMEGLMERLAGQFESVTEKVRCRNRGVEHDAPGDLRAVRRHAERREGAELQGHPRRARRLPAARRDGRDPRRAEFVHPVVYDEADKVEWDLKSFGDLGARATFTRRTRIATITGLSA